MTDRVRCLTCRRMMIPWQVYRLPEWIVGVLPRGRMNCGGDCWRCCLDAERATR